METITLKVRTKAQVEQLLTKIKEIETPELMIKAKYTPTKAKKKAVRKNTPIVKAKAKIKPKPEEPFTIKGLKEMKLIMEGKLDYKRGTEGLDKI